MAKINFGGVVQDARGKQNGLVYSKNGSGSYVKRKVTPVNPNTISQQNVRSTFATLSQQWSGLLTDSERSQWTSFAKTYPITDVFGNSITLNGLNMYIRLNAALINAGQTPTTTPPSSTYTPPIPIEADSLDITAGTPLVEFGQAAAGSTGLLFYVFATKGLPPGRSSVRADYRYIGTHAQVTGTYPTLIVLTSEYTAVFGSPIAGTKVYLLISTLDPTIGIPTVGVGLVATVGT